MVRGLRVEDPQCEAGRSVHLGKCKHLWDDGGQSRVLPPVPSLEESVSHPVYAPEIWGQTDTLGSCWADGLGLSLPTLPSLPPGSFGNFLCKSPSKVRGAVRQVLNDWGL